MVFLFLFANIFLVSAFTTSDASNSREKVFRGNCTLLNGELHLSWRCFPMAKGSFK